ncbi:MAG: putative two-component system response regulator [Phenylobacterium sp.]|jgi:putative two-component system response regulator
MEAFSARRVLICDDSISNLLMLTALVEEDSDIKVDTTADPQRVSSMLLQKEYDLLILDLEMPQMSGFQVLELVRQHYTIDEFPVLIVTGKQGDDVLSKALLGGANDFINKPFNQIEVTLRVRNLLKIRQAVKYQRQANEFLEKEVEIRTDELNKTTDNLIHSIAVAGDLRDDETAFHVVRVGKYAGCLARAMGLPFEVSYMIEKTAPMHDIGKIGVPDKILLKQGKLSSVEARIMQEHTRYAEQIFGDNHSLLIQMAKSIAVSHHERWDGTGYCAGLKGEQIPIEGRITTICDVFDTLTSKGVNKEAWPVEKAAKHLKDHAGSAFDPALVDLFIKHLPEMTVIMTTFADETPP